MTAGLSTTLSGRRIGLVTASASRLGGGVFEAVIAQSEIIRSLGGEPAVFALADADSARDRPRFGSTSVTTVPVFGPRQIGYAPDLVRALLRAELDCLHLHGLWMYPSAAGSRWAAKTGRAYIVSPHGMLAPWITSRGKWKKALARAGYERQNWRRAGALHALTRAEREDIAAESGREDATIIPNAAGGITSQIRPTLPQPIFTYIGRIHPKKNLEALVNAWHGLKKPAGARLQIAGWGDEPAVGRLRQAMSGGDGSATFLGPVYGNEKIALLDQSRFVVLPSHSEGLPMAILEAWARGVPTIQTEECHLPEGFESGSAIDCGYASASIARALSEALTMEAARWQKMSRAALDLARTRFSSDRVASLWANVYAGLMQPSSSNRL